MRRLRLRERRCAAALLLALMLTLAFSAGVSAQGPAIDRNFADWAAYGNITDPQGDSPAPSADLTTFAWDSQPNGNSISFMIERASPPRKDDKVYYNIYLDTNNNGSVNEAADRRINVFYDPKGNKSRITVTVYNGAGGVISRRSGDWGQSDKEGGRQVEFAVSFADLGIQAHQTINMYLTAGDAPVGGPIDRAPDSGTITWAPIPTLGWALTGILVAGGLGLVWYTHRRRVWVNT